MFLHTDRGQVKEACAHGGRRRRASRGAAPLSVSSRQNVAEALPTSAPLWRSHLQVTLSCSGSSSGTEEYLLTAGYIPHGGGLRSSQFTPYWPRPESSSNRSRAAQATLQLAGHIHVAVMASVSPQLSRYRYRGCLMIISG